MPFIVDKEGFSFKAKRETEAASKDNSELQELGRTVAGSSITWPMPWILCCKLRVLRGVWRFEEHGKVLKCKPNQEDTTKRSPGTV